MRNELVIQAGQPSAQHRVLFSFLNAPIVQPTSTTHNHKVNHNLTPKKQKQKKKRKFGRIWKLLSYEPRAPAEGGCGEVEDHTRGHLELELVLEALGVGHDGLGVLLLLLHANVHVAHGNLVVQARHPAVWVLPRDAVEAELLRLLWGLRRGWR